ncbi:MAG: hypothetical protein ABFS35_11920 [Bacteroidota bacterium]
MLLGDFYKYSIDEQKEGNINTSIEINSKHPIFNGHFPEFPVVPGVCQILMVKEILSEILNVNFQLSTANSIKFLSLLNPNENNKIQGTISYSKEDDSKFKINATLYSEGQNYLKLKGAFFEKK